VRRVCRVAERTVETPSTVTLRFDLAAPSRPGQFVMLWIPGDDELPMSLSYVEERKGVTVKRMGDTSGRILGVRPGDPVGIRGPYGHPFDLAPRRVLVVGGGSGTAVLAPAVEAASRRGAKVTVALGATTAAELLFAERLRAAADRLELATDDGSRGRRGFVTGLAEELLRTQPFDAVWTCGPEIMMRKVAEAAAPRSIPVYCSVERHMKCALGLCDACSLGPYHVCTDGPVFAASTLFATTEFGQWHRDASGRRVGPGAGAPAAPRDGP
jgi:dihydroorotate dehydrogenase electron transfer subunit